MTSAVATRTRLLDAAERLFAASGVEGCSLRQITGEAGANLAAVHYHFGSKQDLVRAVIERRLRPINAERLARLDALEAEAGARGPGLRDLLHAFLEPALSLGMREGREFFVFIARAHGNPTPELRELICSQFDEVAARYGAALGRACPRLPRDELLWRVHFVVGALCHTVVNSELLEEISKGACRADDEAAMLERLVDFAAAGLAAPDRDRARNAADDPPADTPGAATTSPERGRP